ncbi:UDP-galactopyranose/dTDP-fucopyranose mutase family protein [Xanthobacter aminoxidans]|uniref:UDP-galactopyranose/dTDP-fucopyranose mutase family protein n=1 Tax=Xanthobacter aminoxidans TaxID=186280 RepID=UPI00372C0201
MNRICIVGAGFTGAVLAREIAEAGLASLVVDSRSHIAGNCHTEIDSATGVMVHAYGPHIFHTGYQDVWDYITRFTTMMPYVNRVKTTVGGKVYSLPINLHTINQFFGTHLSPKEAREFITIKADTSIVDPQNFEEQALRFIGNDLYRAFFYGYTLKQWGTEPRNLPASILKRLPIRFNYDDNYFAHPFQGIPMDGYTDIIAKILDHELIEVRTKCRYEDLDETFEHTFYSGPIDRYFSGSIGRLDYRTLDFKPIRTDEDDFQGVAVMNYGDVEVPYTRISEHKHFAPWRAGQTKGSICFEEHSRACGEIDIPYYPLRLANDKEVLEGYVKLAESTPGVTFVGRLGTYQYLDMDETINRAFATAKAFLEARSQDKAMLAFVHRPL